MYAATITGSDGLIEVRAYGGTRRQRGAQIAAVVRRLRAEGRAMTRYHIRYDEASGFLAMTLAKYRV